MNQGNALPGSWAWTTLGELGEWTGGGTPSKQSTEYWYGGTIPWVSPKDMKRFRILDTEDHVRQEALSETVVRICPPGTILIVVRSGILQRVLPVAIADVPVTMNQDMKGISCAKGIESAYVAYFLASRGRDILHNCSKDGTTVASIETEKLRRYSLPVPPTPEQRRIVEAIEQQFTRLDVGVAALKRAKAALKRYRAAVLKAAVEGKLTAAWRAAHPDVEPASDLLTRILAERRAKWEADVRGKGKDPANTRYIAPDAPDTSNLPELPEGWCWASLAQCSNRITDGTHQPPRFVSEGIPFVFVQHIVGGLISFENTRFISEETFKELNARCPVEIGDILYSAVGSYGVAVPVSTSLPFSFQRHIAHIKLSKSLSQGYFVHCLNSPWCLTQAHSAARGVAQKTVTLGDLTRYVVPLPPLAEQEQIVAEVEERLSIVSELETTVEANLKRAERLRQSILERAFAGKLVPQIPDDEPASMLLKRIRERREGPKSSGRTANRRTGHHEMPVTTQAALWDKE